MKIKNKLSVAFVFALSLFSSLAQASQTASFFVTPNVGVVQFLQGTDTAGTYKTLFTGATNGSVIKSIYGTSSDGTATHLVTCQLVRSTVKYGGTAFTMPLSAGFITGQTSVSALSAAFWPGLPLDSDGNPFIYLMSGDTLQCTFATALTTSTLLNLVAIGSDQ